MTTQRFQRNNFARSIIWIERQSLFLLKISEKTQKLCYKSGPKVLVDRNFARIRGKLSKKSSTTTKSFKGSIKMPRNTKKTSPKTKNTKNYPMRNQISMKILRTISSNNSLPTNFTKIKTNNIVLSKNSSFNHKINTKISQKTPKCILMSLLISFNHSDSLVSLIDCIMKL